MRGQEYLVDICGCLVSEVTQNRQSQVISFTRYLLEVEKLPRLLPSATELPSQLKPLPIVRIANLYFIRIGFKVIPTIYSEEVE